MSAHQTIDDYRAYAEYCAATHGLDKGLCLAVGGNFAATGQIEAALLRFVGLKDGDFLIDVGCGVGRLSAALSRGEAPSVRYHGIDVVEPFLAYARKASSPEFQFTLIDGWRIPEKDAVADFVTFFSVMTHLHQHESYAYLTEAKRVLKPGGTVVLSFFEFQNALHWPIFQAAVEHLSVGRVPMLNAFVEESTLRTWAGRLGFLVDHMFHAGRPFVPLPTPVTYDDGTTSELWVDLGQSVAVLRKA